MNGSDARTTWTLTCALVVTALAMWAPRVAAYQSYDDGFGNGCVECHFNGSASGGFTGGPSTGLLHLEHTSTFGITSCALCHPTSGGGDLPVLTYVSGAGYGCAGCHGVDYGQTSPNSGQPKSTAYGLRAVHASAGVPVCAGCHFPGSPGTGEPDPAPAVLPETVQPPYYGLPFDNLVDPCSAAQESFEGAAGVGLDNDGNGLRDMDDLACAARVGTPTPHSTPAATNTPVASPTPFTGRKSTKVHPGESIQAAVDGAAIGGKIYVKPGVYRETHDGVNAVTVNKDGIRLIGLPSKAGGKVILQQNLAQRNGVVVEPSPGVLQIQGFRIKGFTVQGFPNNGIVARSVNDFRIEKNESIDNKENGIWPILSANGLVKKNVSYGSDDSAMWVEDSTNVRVLKNVTYDSVTGIELSNSDDILVQGNESYNNAVGIGLYMQPGRHRKESNRWTVTDNYLHDNNKANTAPPGSMAGDLPAGGGILLLGPDNNLIENNRIENNNFYGLVIIDYCTATSFGSFNCIDNPPDFDPNPDNNQVMYNEFSHNGTSPPDHPMAPLASDIVVFGAGTNNCFWGNTYGTSWPLHSWELQSCF